MNVRKYIPKVRKCDKGKILPTILLISANLIKEYHIFENMISNAEPSIEWFDSQEYQLLYQHRNSQEAELLINHLVNKIQLNNGARVLDLACGRGRHSVLLNAMGYDVTGLDAGADNIKYANNYSNDRLQFYVQDIRNYFRLNYFDLAVCLFTSFGYYASDYENAKIIKSASLALKPKGYFILDFLNKNNTLRNLIPVERKKINGIDFLIRKFIEEKNLVKEINFRKDNTDKQFQERVRLYERNDFIKMFTENNLKNIEIYGDYKLNPFVEDLSERLILIAKKNV